jgi:hypothetical protein
MIGMPGHCRRASALQRMPCAARPGGLPGFGARIQMEQIRIHYLSYDGQLNAVRRHLRGCRCYQQE